MDDSHDPPERFESALDRLHEIVAAELRWDDFGAPDYIPGLRVLLQSMDYDARFSKRGRRFAWGNVVGVLRGRAHAIRAMRRHPDYADAAIESPVVITGIPRSGTTALHRLLAVDPRFQGLQSWLLDAPMPRPSRREWASNPEFRKSVAQLESRYREAPGKRAAHDVIAEDVHECCMLLRQGFVSNILSCMWPAPTYDAWWQSRDATAAYRHYRACVQLIGNNDRDTRWLLKNPGHIDNLDLLFAMFPDARVIQTHRDPAKAVPSLCSVLMQLHPVFERRPAAERARIMLRRETGKWANAVRRADRVRATRPDQVMDVVHADFHRDPVGVIERIYAFIGMTPTDPVRVAMAERIAAKPELAHGAHSYDIANFGMTAEEVREPFGDYVRRYDLKEEPAAA
jgi:hypothetical protein